MSVVQPAAARDPSCAPQAGGQRGTGARLGEPFAAAHAALMAAADAAPAWAREHRRQAFAACMAAPAPSRQDEEWKYTSLRSVAELSFAMPSPAARPGAPLPAGVAARLARLVDPEDLTLVFVDGALAPAAGQDAPAWPAGLTVTPLAEALASRRERLERSLAADAGASPFAALNGAFLRDGVVLEIAKGVACRRRVHLIHVASGDPARATALFPRCIIALGESAEAQVVESFLGPEAAPEGAQPYFVGAVTDLELAPNAKLRHARLQVEGPRALHIASARATLARDASLKTLSFSAGAKLARIDLDVALTAPGADVRLAGLYLAKGGQHVDHHTSVDHLVPDGTSSQLYKGILGGAGRAVFNGKVFVRPGAQRTNAFQLNRNLLLSSEAEVDTKPELQIDADDVKCSHGAAVGQLDHDQLFYLQSRGLTRAAAEHVLAEAFAGEVLLEDIVPGLAGSLGALTREFLTREFH